MKSEGKYVLILKFSEVYFKAADEKVFDVALGDKIILKNLDIFSMVGKAAAYDEYVEIELKNNKIIHNKVEAENAYDSDKKALIIRFIKGPKDNPKINGIVILEGTIQGNLYLNTFSLRWIYLVFYFIIIAFYTAKYFKSF